MWLVGRRRRSSMTFKSFHNLWWFIVIARVNKRENLSLRLKFMFRKVSTTKASWLIDQHGRQRRQWDSQLRDAGINHFPEAELDEVSLQDVFLQIIDFLTLYWLVFWKFPVWKYFRSIWKKFSVVELSILSQACIIQNK